MALKVTEEKKNPLLKRKEAWMHLEHTGKPTPARKDLIKDAAKALKAKEDLIIIDKIFSEKGKGATKVKALVYSKKDDIPKALADKMERRLGLKKEGEEEKPAESAPSEKPEEKKEEKPKEEKEETKEKGKEEKPEKKKEEKSKEESK